MGPEVSSPFRIPGWQVADRRYEAAEMKRVDLLEGGEAAKKMLAATA